MKVERISEHVWSLKTWLLFPIRVWLVADGDGLTLIDAGMSLMANGIRGAIEATNAGPLQRILLTHGHGDHTGSVKEILRHQPVPVYAHATEIPYLEGDLPYPRRKKAQPALPKGLVGALSEGPGGQLATVAGLRPYLTPGHSPGHVVYYHEQDQVLLAGDLFTSKRGQLRRPMAMFTGDMEQAIASSAVVELLKPKRLEICHGEAVFNPAEQMDQYRKL